MYRNLQKKIEKLDTWKLGATYIIYNCSQYQSMLETCFYLFCGSCGGCYRYVSVTDPPAFHEGFHRCGRGTAGSLDGRGCLSSAQGGRAGGTSRKLGRTWIVIGLIQVDSGILRGFFSGKIRRKPSFFPKKQPKSKCRGLLHNFP